MNFLFELLCEEIPANALPSARQQLAQGVRQKLAEASVTFSSLQVFSTSRRLSLFLTGLPNATPEKVQSVQGPPVAAAFAPDGSYTRAAEGFARACGVLVQELEVVEGPKGKVVAATRRLAGKPMAQFLGEVLSEVVLSLHFPKTMRWGEGDYTFVRPVHRLVALFGEKTLNATVPMELFGVRAGSRTQGHRVFSSHEVELRGTVDVEDYRGRLRSVGVVVDPEERRMLLRQRAEELALAVGCQVRPDPALEEEHVELVEYPGVVRGELAPQWLQLPEEILVATLRHHQKCLILTRDNRLAPYFLAVCDRPNDPEGHVRRGNEWVAGARLADAQFFFHQDLQTSLESMAQKLEQVAFHVKVGSYGEKSRRVAQLTDIIVGALQREDLAPVLQEAARLAKADLTSLTVGEFPELQGIMGGIFAKLAGYPEPVWRAIQQQYQPLGQEGAIPDTLPGAILGVADRMDTLAALFSLGELPSGSRDPFALRRQALSVVRICGEFPLPLRLGDLVDWGLAPFGGEKQQALVEFLRERERFYLEWRGLPGPVVEAVMSAGWGMVAEDEARGRALAELWRQPEFVQAATAFKRVRNMVGKEGEGRWQPGLLREQAEKHLAFLVARLEDRIPELVSKQEWLPAFRALAELAGPLEAFFNDVLVLCEDQELREARLGLLAAIQRLFLRLADVAKLQGAN